VGKCPKDKIRAHIYSPSSFDRPYAHFQGNRGLALRSVDRFSISYVLDATALFREQFFRLVFCRPTGTGMIPCAPKNGASGGIPRMRLKLPACRAAASSVPNEPVTPGSSITFF
jgi:hypothetical protein